VVEQNRDAQLRSLLTLETDVPKSKLHSILHYDGSHDLKGDRGRRHRRARRRQARVLISAG